MGLTRPLQRNVRREQQGAFVGNQMNVVIGPVPPGPSWEIKQITIVTNFKNPIIQTTTFVGTNNSGQRISTAIYGNEDTDSMPNTTLRYGESLCAFFNTNGVTGVPAGATARMTIIYDEVAY
jgi:hypothetical protein